MCGLAALTERHEAGIWWHQTMLSWEEPVRWDDLFSRDDLNSVDRKLFNQPNTRNTIAAVLHKFKKRKKNNCAQDVDIEEPSLNDWRFLRPSRNVNWNNKIIHFARVLGIYAGVGLERRLSCNLRNIFFNLRLLHNFSVKTPCHPMKALECRVYTELELIWPHFHS